MDIANKISMVLGDVSLQKELRQKGFMNITRFSWQRSAKKIIQTIKELE
jgi:glycosyltransferase involved in cell wall biosynthesis